METEKKEKKLTANSVTKKYNITAEELDLLLGQIYDELEKIEIVEETKEE